METSERPRISILQLLLFCCLSVLSLFVSLFLLCYRYHLEKSNKSHSKFYSWCFFSLYPALASSNPAMFPHLSMLSWWVAVGYLALGTSLPLPSPELLSQLTQQDDDAQQDGNQSPCTETRRGQEGLALAHTDPAVTLAWTHPEGQSAGSAQGWLPAIPNHNGYLV